MGTSNLKILILFILCSFSLISCQNKKMEEKYKWTGTLSAPKEYQMQVYYGQLIADDYQYPFTDIWGNINNGWGNDGGSGGTTDKLVGLPHTLEFTWYSLVEDKFYAGHWDLDKEKIKKLFQEGFSQTYFDSFKKGTYDSFIVGLAPKGRLVVWLSGGGHQVEIGSFQGKEIIITKEEAYDKFKYVFEPGYREEMLKDKSSGGLTDDLVFKKIKEKGYPDPKLYDDFREKFNWAPKVILPEGSTLQRRSFSIANGEKEVTLENNSEKSLPLAQRAVPYLFYFLWKDKDGKKYNSQIVFTGNPQYIKEANKIYNSTFLPLDFSTTEIYKLFKEKLDKNASVDLIFDFSSNESVKVYAEQNGKKYPLTQMDQYVKLQK